MLALSNRFLIGIVPILSVFKKNIDQLLQIDPVAFFEKTRQRQEEMLRIECAEDHRKGSIAMKVIRGFTRSNDDDDDDEKAYSTDSLEKRDTIRRSVALHDTLKSDEEIQKNLRSMKEAAFSATLSIYGVVLLTALPVLGVVLMSITISWNTTPFTIYPAMVNTLKYLTVMFQSLFAIAAIVVWESTGGLLEYVDVAMCAISPFVDVFWFQTYATRRLTAREIALYCIHIGYMTGRCWYRAVVPARKIATLNHDASLAKLERFHLCWVTRYPSQVAAILPSILSVWDCFVTNWGLENAQKVFSISVYVTCKDHGAFRQLLDEFLPQDDMERRYGVKIRYGRPDFSQVLEDHTIEAACSRRFSYSLLAFCGSPTLGRVLHSLKISNDILTVVSGNKKHRMEFISDYSGAT